MVEPFLGLDAALIDGLRGNVDAVVNVAGVVDFSPPLDEALEVNAFGVNNLVGLARALGARVMHTSTCYVAGYRSGLIEEVDPREVPFPRAEGETWYGASTPHRTLEKSHWDPQREIEECLDLIKQALPRLTANIPPAINVTTLLDRTVTIRASLQDVEFTLGLTIVLVVLVILLLLGKL